MPSIYVESGVEEGAAWGFPPGDVIFVVGRAPNCNIVITDPLVSRQHCRIERIDGRYRVVDLGSHNGVLVNEEKMPANSSREISFGDCIRLGETGLILKETAPDDEGELAGRKLGGYQLVKRIGSGGMGEVYRAVQVALGRQVAIKILSPELTEDRTFVERFMSEARAAGRLNHQNVAQVHEVGESDGIYYYSMEYLGGGSVQDRIRGNRSMPVLEATRMVLGAARALEYAEKQGVIHCDVKPDNLMLTDDGEVRLTDLGIARTVRSAAEKVKQEGGVLGSPHYMAPEQARGEAIDHRIDIYALGATFYRMISGRTPFSGRNAREIMEKQVYEEPPGLRTINPEIPQSVCRVITRLMKKKPEKRYQTAREAAEDIALLLEELSPPKAAAGQPAGGGQQGSRAMRRASKTRGRTAALAAAGAVAGALLLVALLWSGFLSGGGEATRQRGLERMMAEAAAAEGTGQLELACSHYERVIQAAAGGPLAERAAQRVKELRGRMDEAKQQAAAEAAWRSLDERKGRASSPQALRELAAAYADFAARHAASPRAAAAQLAARSFREKYEKAAADAVQAFREKAAALAAGCRYGELRQEWERLARLHPDSPAGREADELAQAAARLAAEDLRQAVAEAEQALAEQRFDDVLKPLERFRGSDISQLVIEANTARAGFSAKVQSARDELQRQAERQRRLEACAALRREGEALAHRFDYIAARSKLVDAQLRYRSEGVEEAVAVVQRLTDEYWSERVLFDRLREYAGAGRLSAAMVKLADGLNSRLVRVGMTGVVCSRTINEEREVPWAELPLGSLYDLLRRPRLEPDERVILARFALRRGLFAQAVEQIQKVLEDRPERREVLAPMLEEAEAGAKTAPGGTPGAGAGP